MLLVKFLWHAVLLTLPSDLLVVSRAENYWYYNYGMHCTVHAVWLIVQGSCLQFLPSSTEGLTWKLSVRVDQRANRQSCAGYRIRGTLQNSSFTDSVWCGWVVSFSPPPWVTQLSVPALPLIIADSSMVLYTPFTLKCLLLFSIKIY
jgi:hypothetical protein